jgi:NarL family two-component system response regulator LiaR
MAPIRVVVADDHAILREGIKVLLQGQSDISVVGEAEDGRQAVQRCQELRPDVVLMDIAMPGLGGYEATLEIRRLMPTIRVLVLTQYDNKEYVLRFLRAGAAGYVVKKAVATEVLSAIRAVARGETYLHADIAGAVVEDYLGGERPSGEDVYDRLSEREKQVLKLIAEGSTNKEIASLLDIAVKTVMAHRTNLMAKIGAHSRTDIFKFALRKGLIVVEPDDE